MTAINVCSNFGDFRCSPLGMEYWCKEKILWTLSNGKEMSLKGQERSSICYQSHDIQSKTTPLPR